MDAFPLNASETQDSDGDGMGNNFETTNGFNDNDPADAEEDADADGVINRDEFLDGTDPLDPNDPPPSSTILRLIKILAK